ncbi:acylneuraminate cytidylyltransferase family protein [Aliivibrio finisterrensis]|uniref:acylneuraminate cytidylyltransferase family protein n=1 Tax=Aliivibrio finisterrensis TaxID=511998 RepID=UPI00101F4F48|nr:acylneuraminate cytidylyltransferase family protein [Aliivibrio finisterrensis]RYU67840.1 acylneuraminate cytidylyltransferase family protein [Aliivibrio finisterrensis]RYU71499.1 acylneuraminate cytidylyltransferase family protein [Aliivibrio finisterrensis]RYU74661.1 acylneuraminate cytidylyltransferase family protein [Aliivibrio finisterrensis]
MINNKKVMAIIPARGGSKRLPRKNVLPLKGKPLIGWTIEAAQQSKYIDTVFVSTDDQEIAEVAKQFGVDVPELRPEYLASDIATTQSVIFYTLETFGKDVDVALILQPTSPLRTAKHIDEAIEMLINKNAESIVSVTPCEHPPQWANTLPSDGSMGEFLRPEAFQRSQDLGEPYRLNGAIYVYDTIQLKERGEMLYTDKTFAYVMENKKSVDIDTQLDFEYAEFLIRK